MPSFVLSNVQLAFTQNMMKESEYGGYNYSFIIDKGLFCDSVRKALAIQKTKLWDDSKNTDAHIIKLTNAKSRDDVTHEDTKASMKDTDVLVQVKCKTHPIENTKGVPLGRGTIANILIDVFEYAYGKKQFICVRSHADKGLTVEVVDLKEFGNAPKYFNPETPGLAIETAAMNDVYAESEDVAPF